MKFLTYNPEQVTRPIFCTSRCERVYMTACGCETSFGEGMDYRPPAPGACNPAPSGAAPCCSEPAKPRCCAQHR